MTTYCHLRNQLYVERRIVRNCIFSRGTRRIIQQQRNSLPTMCLRLFGTQDQEQSRAHVDPFTLARQDLLPLYENIKQELLCEKSELQEAAQYLFDGQGKALRPMIISLVARACNIHNNFASRLLDSQRKIAMVAEMFHTASLVHDDVIDASDTRRGKATVHKHWGHKKAILSGNFIISASIVIMAKIRNEDVVEVLSQVLEDLVRGEFMQLGSKEDENERFGHYLRKNFKKTASLIANCCKAVAILANSCDEVEEISYQYGRNVGMAFQLTDDLLDYTSDDKLMGKPTAADLRLGLATAPVLFAAQEHPELNALIMRRFSEEGDVETARNLVTKSDGVAQTRMLAEQYCKEAVKQIKRLVPSAEREALIALAKKVLTRIK